MIIVFGILTLTVILFASDRLRLDVVALMAVLLLLLTGILTPAEALAGFSDPIVLIIAGLFIVGAGLFRTGVADALGAATGAARRHGRSASDRCDHADRRLSLSILELDRQRLPSFCRWSSVWRSARASARRNCSCPSPTLR
jgi:di/tricarboxylate transporter